ncbi:DUF3073 domain-containing protein [Streptosporangium sp. NPDC000396]|uniref:DUF3073 domain-containing protein n=1 Tax=Streptosporangium sp. NPDC000396 TaxID=3366185 RepID=UPI0036907C54
MGRGRSKAKQTKVARELKYTSHNLDLDRLRAELSSEDSAVHDDADVSPATGHGEM